MSRMTQSNPQSTTSYLNRRFSGKTAAELKHKAVNVESSLGSTALHAAKKCLEAATSFVNSHIGSDAVPGDLVKLPAASPTASSAINLFTERTPFENNVSVSVLPISLFRMNRAPMVSAAQLLVEEELARLANFRQYQKR